MTKRREEIDLTEEDERILSRVWAEIGRENGTLPPIPALTDAAARMYWDHFARIAATKKTPEHRRDRASKLWITVLHRRLSEMLDTEPHTEVQTWKREQLNRERDSILRVVAFD